MSVQSDLAEARTTLRELTVNLDRMLADATERFEQEDERELLTDGRERFC